MKITNTVNLYKVSCKLIDLTRILFSLFWLSINIRFVYGFPIVSLRKIRSLAATTPTMISTLSVTFFTLLNIFCMRYWYVLRFFSERSWHFHRLTLTRWKNEGVPLNQFYPHQWVKNLQKSKNIFYQRYWHRINNKPVLEQKFPRAPEGFRWIRHHMDHQHMVSASSRFFDFQCRYWFCTYWR